MTEQAVNVAAVAEYLGLHQNTVYAKAKAGDIPGFQISGRTWRFFISEIDAALRSNPDGFAQSPQSRGRKRAA